MQIFTRSPIFSLFLFLLLLAGVPSPPPAAASLGSSSANDSAHKLLQKFGFPRGLLPGNVVNYTVAKDGEFSVELAAPCYIQFSELAYYHRVIRGRISRRLISGVSGIQAKKFLFWVAISSIAADEEHSAIQLSNGAITVTVPAADFADVRHCRKRASSYGATV
ncbi:unnamed protein product [Spirodela intermedia]|uniref:Uncharacterized protein n=1 Tax=Spirodela intermedia TaxID=51605 RepID=A0A7I8KP64_SPIIN|nr:unnamed protein product [Spirodela intermedia]